MPLMDKHGWNRVEELFEEALERPPETRHTFIAESCHGDTELLAEVESLLSHDTIAPEAFMQPPEDSRGLTDPSNSTNLSDLTESFNSREADARIGTKIDRYKIVRVIGTGGMGTVYLARQDRPRRDVALKVMKAGLTSRSATRRFELEAQILADLRHPHIAQVYEAGQQRFDETGGPGALYFAMEYVPNARGITAYADDRRLTTTERIRLFTQVCEAIHHGHQQGIVHRDLKPSNILIDDAGRVKVIDFGVAHSTNADVAITTLQTASSRLIGTLQYMSPEQCSGDARAVDSRSDVYSLGVVLYELLTGKTPYDVRSVMLFEAIRIVSEQPPAAPRRQDRRLKGDIEVILLKALEKDPGQRYQSAAELAADLRRVVEGQPIMARPPSLTYVLKRSALRHKWRTAAMLTGILLFLAIIVLALTTRWARETRKANANLSAANARAAVIAYGAKVSAAESAVLADDAARARVLLDQTDKALRGWEWRHLSYRADLSTWSTKTQAVPKKLAIDLVHRRVVAVGSKISCVGLFDVDTGDFIQDFPCPAGQAVAAAFSADGRLLAIASKDVGLSTESQSQIDLWRMDPGNEPVLRYSWRCPGAFSSASVGLPPLNDILVSGTIAGVLQVWDLDSADSHLQAGEPVTPILSIHAHDDQVVGLAFQPGSGKILATAGDDFTVRLWDMATLLRGSPEAALATLRGHTDYVKAVAFSPDGQTLASGSVDGTIHLWNMKEILKSAKAPRLRDKALTFVGDGRNTLTGHTGPVTALAFDQTGDRLVSGSGDRTIRCWKIARHAALSNPEGTQSWTTPRWSSWGTLSGHAGPLTDVAFIDRDRIISSGADCRIKSWSLASHKMIQLAGHFTSLTDTVFTPDSRYVITAADSSDDSFIIWEAATCFPLVRRVLRDQESVESMACWRHGERVLLATATTHDPDEEPNGRVIIWDITDPADPRVLETPSEMMKAPLNFTRVALSRNGRKLAAGTSDGGILVWNVSDLDNIGLVGQLAPFNTEIQALEFLDSNGEWLASAGNWHRYTMHSTEPEGLDIMVNEVEESRRFIRLSGHSGIVSAVAINPAMNLLASGSWDRTIRLWNIAWENGAPQIRLKTTFTGHTDAVRSISFHPYEPRLLSSSSDRTLKAWDVDFGVEVATLHGPVGVARRLAFAPDGERLAVGSFGELGTDNVTWLLETGQAVRHQQRREVVMGAHEAVRDILRNQAPGSLEDVRRMIEADTHLPQDVREFATRHIRNFLPNPHWFYTRNQLAMKQRLTPEQLRTTVLPWAKLAVEMAPDSVLYRESLHTIEKLSAKE